MPLNEQIAQRMITASHEKANEIGVKVSTAIFDADGRLFAFGRMIGSPWTSIEVSQGKAFTGTALRKEGPAIKETPPPVLASLSVMYHRATVAANSITLLKEGDVVIGAIGCSGAKDEEDGECAQAARDAYSA